MGYGHRQGHMQSPGAQCVAMLDTLNLEYRITPRVYPDIYPIFWSGYTVSDYKDIIVWFFKP